MLAHCIKNTFFERSVADDLAEKKERREVI